MRKKQHDYSPLSDLIEAYEAAAELFGKESIEQYTPVRDKRVRRGFAAKFTAPERPTDGASHILGPYDYWGRKLFWLFDEKIDDWDMVELTDLRLKVYQHRRWEIATLADEQRDRMEQEELIAFLIQACIVTGFRYKPEIVEVIEFATMIEEEEIDRVLKRHRGKSAARPIWWVDRQKSYHLFAD
jgi:hypothetical protein